MATKHKKISSKQSAPSKRNSHAINHLFKRKENIVILIVVAIGVLALGIYGKKYFPQITRYAEYLFCAPKLPESDIYGIDVSIYQENIDWGEMGINYDIVTRRIRKEKSSGRKRVEFAIAKATEGATITDNNLEMNRKGIRAAGLRFGAYHFLSPTSSAKQQAERFIAEAKLERGDIVPVLDVEKIGRLTTDELRALTLEWLEIIGKHYKCHPLIYTSASFRNNYLNSSEFDDYEFWIAHYTSGQPSGECAFWQFTDKGHVEGIDGKVDIDAFRGKRKELNKYIINN